MKKLVLVLLILLVAASSAFAFDILSYPPPLEGGGDFMIDVGVGLAAYGWGGKISIPPLFLDIEYALPVMVPISVGGFVSFFQYKYAYQSLWNEKWTFVVSGARANWHWGFDVEWLDFYTGIWMGYRYFRFSSDKSVSSGYNKPTYGGFDWGTQVGAHFYFTNIVGVIVESGYPYWIKAGLALKF